MSTARAGPTACGRYCLDFVSGPYQPSSQVPRASLTCLLVVHVSTNRRAKTLQQKLEMRWGDISLQSARCQMWNGLSWRRGSRFPSLMCCETFKSIRSSLEHWRDYENGREDQGDRAYCPAGRDEPGTTHDTVLGDIPHCPLSHLMGVRTPVLQMICP